MRNLSSVWVVLFAFLGFSLILNAGDKEIPVTNSNFEQLGAGNLPANWTIRDSQKIPGVRVLAVKDNGQTHLLMEHKEWGQSTMVSDPLPLKVGHLYRLSGRVKTESAATWPTHRYPTSVAACLTMESFPFTNHSPSAGGDSGWNTIETLFIASKSQDRVRLHLGFNGQAKGSARFDDIKVEKVEDISHYIPMETVRWFDKGFRYDDKGWIFVHIEGKPYQRGYQYGYLVADEIVAYMKKLGYRQNLDDVENGWGQLRRITDAFFLRKYDEEYLTEMKGIADGAAKAGAKFEDRKIDLIDIVTLNTSIDIGQAWSALRRTPHNLSGKSFLHAEDELNIPMRQHKCSGFLANGPASKDGGIVFGQIFMWNGYTGVHWNVICDVVPDKGHRIVYETYPGGIHSGADFYINSTGLMMGETTVSQTPFDSEGTPQSFRIRKAAQYASSIDEAVRILKHKNNGQYTNDWLMADTKTNEIAIFLLGTKKTKLWRSSTGEFPGGTKGFYWSNNNNKDPEVRKEYIPHPENAPYDLVFSPWNRDIAFNEFFKKTNGKIDAIAGVNLWASSPINRAHACDGKITTKEMAENLVFLAHFGKVTLREKFPGPDNRLLRDKPGATPHLSLGYSIVSPIFVTDKLKELKAAAAKKEECNAIPDFKPDVTEVKDFYSFDQRKLWFNTVYPASEKENWFVSATSAYWSMLRYLPDSPQKAFDKLTRGLAEIDHSLNYTISREGVIAPLEAQRVYDRYNHYRIPRTRGTFLLHQLRLLLGNDTFSNIMNDIHDRFKDKPVTTRQLIAMAGKKAKRPLKSFFMQWLNRTDLPRITISGDAKESEGKWRVDMNVKQEGLPYHFVTTVAVTTAKGKYLKKAEISKKEQRLSFTCAEKPLQVEFNAGNDIPLPRKSFYTFSSYFDDFHHTLFVYGTKQQIEGNRTLTTRYRDLLADRYTEILPEVLKDSEISEDQLATHDIFVIGGAADNTLTKTMARKLGLKFGKNHFQWQGKVYGAHDDGLVAVFPNPYNPKKVVYFVIANSALQLWQMTKTYTKMPSWTLYKGEKVVSSGYHPVKGHVIYIPR